MPNRLATTLMSGSAPSDSTASNGSIDEQDHGHAEHGHGVGDGERDHHHEGLHLLEIGVAAAHQLTGLHLVVVGEVEALDVGEQSVAEPLLDQPCLAEGHVAAAAGEHAGDQAHPGDGQGPHEQRAHVAGAVRPPFDAPVDRLLHQDADAHLADRPTQPDHDAERHAQLAGPEGVEDESPTGASVRTGHMVRGVTDGVVPHGEDHSGLDPRVKIGFRDSASQARLAYPPRKNTRGSPS